MRAMQELERAAEGAVIPEDEVYVGMEDLPQGLVKRRTRKVPFERFDRLPLASVWLVGVAVHHRWRAVRANEAVLVAVLADHRFFVGCGGAVVIIAESAV